MHLLSPSAPPGQALLEREADLRQEEMDEAAAAAPPTRLLLVVHGVGQKLTAANIAQARGAAGALLCWERWWERWWGR